MKILFAYDSMSSIGGGSQIAILKYLKNFTEEFRLLTSQPSADWLIKEEIIPANKIIATNAINASMLMPQWYPSFQLDKTSLQQIIDFSPDVVQLNEPSFIDFTLLSLAKKNGWLIGGFYHTEFDEYRPRIIFQPLSDYRKLLFRNLDFILCPSSTTYQKLTQLFPNKLIRQTTYPINEIFYKSKKEFSINHQLTYIGRLAPEKKIPLILEVLQKLPTEFTLNIVGDGKQKNEIENLIIKKKLQQRVRLLGQKNSLEILELLNKTFLCLYPSQSETFGLVYLEALAAGVPMIVADYSVTREVIPQDCAIFINSDDAQDWVNQVLKINEPKKYLDLCQKIINNNKKLFCYQEKNATQLLINEYQNIIHHFST